MSEESPPKKEIKVTDRRMFTPDGQLREEYEDIDESSSESAADPGPPAEPEPAGGKPPEAPSVVPPTAEAADSERPPLEIPETSDGLRSPGFLDLLAVLAEPIAVYLGDAQLPDGQSIEDLNAARFYIDLLDLLGRKTAGNLTSEESATLERTLYELRLRYVQKRG